MSALRFCLRLYSSLSLGRESAPPLTRVKIRSEFNWSQSSVLGLYSALVLSLGSGSVLSLWLNLSQ